MASDTKDDAELGRHVPEYYSDLVRVAVNPWGFALEFGVLPFPQPGELTLSPDQVVPMVRVRVSPQMAVAIKDILVTNLSAYEDQIGKIAMPPQLVEKSEPQA